ncbi:tetratricopeptide repeat protein [Thalassotalea atypica]|uniref:tetratricopeptide repeat protein n=1 Tax=Thalassotalea atypica TaxID=2054316 RepID=UPI002572566E|nr:tetratricopeptide repeat protein [Thalassotalea atypica]
MNLKCLFIIELAISALFASQLTFAHDGHDTKDMIVTELGDLGRVDFSSSCNDEAQSAINTGVALLHHMMYAQAEKHFNQWIEKQPDCAMLYWGYAMTLFHPLWPDTISKEALILGHNAITTAKTLTSSKRESDYIDAAAAYYHDWNSTPDKKRIGLWAVAQKQVFDNYPNDLDATAFYALSQLVTAPKTDGSFSQQKQAGELLSKIYRKSPTHPGAIHYTIHAYDNPVLAEQAVSAARAYDKIAPDVPHALHMPSHIFVRIGYWEDVISWNIRSAKAALNFPTKGSTSMHYVHAVDYLVYGYMQSQQTEKALAAYQEIKKHHPIQTTFPAAYAMTTIPVRIVLETNAWQKASQLQTRQPDYFNWDNFPEVEAITYYARGLGAVRSQNIKAAHESLAVLNTLYEKTLAKSPTYWAILVDAQRQTLDAWIKFETGNKAKAISQLRRAANLEDSLDKNPVTPGAVLPARELLGDMLLLRGDYEAAISAFEASLNINPNRAKSIKGISLAKSQLSKL